MRLQDMETPRKWQINMHVAHRAHFKAAARAERLSQQLGVPAVILAAFVGTAVFASLEKNPDTTVKIIVGLLGVASAVFGALQTYLGSADLASRHRSAAGRYGAIRRELEELLAAYTDGNPCDQEQLDGVRTKWVDAESSAPSLSQRLYAKVEREVLESSAKGPVETK